MALEILTHRCKATALRAFFAATQRSYSLDGLFADIVVLLKPPRSDWFKLLEDDVRAFSGSGLHSQIVVQRRKHNVHIDSCNAICKHW